MERGRAWKPHCSMIFGKPLSLPSCEASVKKKNSDPSVFCFSFCSFLGVQEFNSGFKFKMIIECIICLPVFKLGVQKEEFGSVVDAGGGVGIWLSSHCLLQARREMLLLALEISIHAY